MFLYQKGIIGEVLCISGFSLVPSRSLFQVWYDSFWVQLYLHNKLLQQFFLNDLQLLPFENIGKEYWLPRSSHAAPAGTLRSFLQQNFLRPLTPLSFLSSPGYENKCDQTVYKVLITLWNHLYFRPHWSIPQQEWTLVQPHFHVNTVGLHQQKPKSIEIRAVKKQMDTPVIMGCSVQAKSEVRTLVLSEKKPQVSHIYWRIQKLYGWRQNHFKTIFFFFFIRIMWLEKTERNNIKCPAMINPMKVLYLS